MTRVYFFKLQISGAKSEIKKTVSALAEDKLIKIASQTLKINPESIKINRTKNGKPYLKGYPDFYFNISHSFTAFAVAVSNRPVGIDIEQIKEPDLAVAKRFFTKEEIDYVNQRPCPRFFEIWTKKEAFIKWQGLTIKDLKNAETKNILTVEKDGFIISVCGEDKDIFFK